jgi:hypothetical protein
MHHMRAPSRFGGRLLARLLRRLCQSLEALGGRVREAVARALSQGVAGVVHEAVEAALSASPDLAGGAPSTYPATQSAVR